MSEQLMKEVLIRFFPEDDAGRILMSVDFPEDYNWEDPRPFEAAALHALEAIAAASEDFEEIEES